MSAASDARTISVSEAASRGVAGLVKDAESGRDLIVSRHGKAVAAVVSIDRLARLDELESDLRDISLILARVGTDNGVRSTLDEAMGAFGFSRAELAAELDRDLAAGLE
jgi:prevent-host-death family protein